jgi:hypothetical protein
MPFACHTRRFRAVNKRTYVCYQCHIAERNWLYTDISSINNELSEYETADLFNWRGQFESPQWYQLIFSYFVVLRS